MFELNVTMHGQRAFNMGLAGIIKKVEDLTPVWESLTKSLESNMESQYAQSGQHDGFSRWQALSEDYAEWKKIKYGDLPILTLTGRLRGSLNQSRNSDAVREIEPQKMKYGTKVEYAAAHQYGYAPNNLPPRPYMRIGESQKRMLRSGVANALRPMIDLSVAQTRRMT